MMTFSPLRTQLLLPLLATFAIAPVTGCDLAETSEDEAYEFEDVEAEEGVEEPVAAADEPVVTIPRPAEGVRQQRLFAGGIDEAMVEDAIDVVTRSGRASANFLQRKLRVDYEQSVELLLALKERGVIELGEGETQGRVLS